MSFFHHILLGAVDGYFPQKNNPSARPDWSTLQKMRLYLKKRDFSINCHSFITYCIQTSLELPVVRYITYSTITERCWMMIYMVPSKHDYSLVRLSLPVTSPSLARVVLLQTTRQLFVVCHTITQAVDPKRRFVCCFVFQPYCNIYFIYSDGAQVRIEVAGGATRTSQMRLLLESDLVEDG